MNAVHERCSRTLFTNAVHDSAPERNAATHNAATHNAATRQRTTRQRTTRQRTTRQRATRQRTTRQRTTRQRTTRQRATRNAATRNAATRFLLCGKAFTRIRAQNRNFHRKRKQPICRILISQQSDLAFRHGMGRLDQNNPTNKHAPRRLQSIFEHMTSPLA